MLKIAVCEDVREEREFIVNMINRALKSKNEYYEIFQFSSGEQLMVSTKDFDIYFLDINMDKLTGIEAAKNIRLINERAVIIFITGLKDYVFQAFDVRAFHYLLKPIKEKKFIEILNNALVHFDENEKYIMAKTNKQATKIFLRDIMYIESQQRKLKVHTIYNTIEYYHKISDIEQELSGDDFFRCHKSYIVNLKYVRSYDNTCITLKNWEIVYVSKYKLSDFSKAFMYCLKNEDK